MSNTELTDTSDDAVAPGGRTDETDQDSGRFERWFGTPTRKLIAIVSALGAIVALVLGLLELWDRTHPPTKPIGATISVLEHPVLNRTLGEFLAANLDAVPSTFSASQRRTNGDVFTVDLTLKGLQGKNATLAWEQLDGSTQDPLGVPSWVPRQVSVRANSDDDELTHDVWVPIPSRGDSMFVRFRITVPGRSAPLKVADSEPLPIG